MSERLTITAFLERLNWIDGRPLWPSIEPYRRRLFERAFSRDAAGGLLYSLILSGRAKKNGKTLDLVLALLFALIDDVPGGNQCYLVANDQDQAGDDLALAKKLVKANPVLQDWLHAKQRVIERRDGNGFLEVLPAQDAIGSHGKTYRMLGVDEIHGYRNYDLLEALAADPTRPDAQQWITSYASLFHKPGVPLYDLVQLAKAGTDSRLLFSWYAGDFTTDAEFSEKTPEERANPSMAGWGNPGYLAQQRRRLPSHKFRRLHLNLPGLPEGSAFQAEPVMDAIDRGVSVRAPKPGIRRVAFVDMSGGSSDAAVLSIAHQDELGRAVLDLVIDQGPPAPFDPNAAVLRFARVLKDYGISSVTGDRYAGLTFRTQFEREGIRYDVASLSASELYEALEPRLNSHQVVLLDVPTLEQQLLGLVWRGGKITHPVGEHDDYCTAVAGVAEVLLKGNVNDAILELYRQQIVGVPSVTAIPAESIKTPIPMPDVQPSQSVTDARVLFGMRTRVEVGGPR